MAFGILEEGHHRARRSERSARLMAVSGLASLSLVALTLSAALPGCGGTSATARPLPAPVAATTPDTARTIEALIHRWYALLSVPDIDAAEFENFLPNESFELMVFGRSIRSRKELRSWIAELRGSYREIQYRVESVHVESDAPPLHHARFEVSRHAVDSDGLPHIARRAQLWELHSPAESAPVILRTKEVELLSFPGTGPRVVCF